MIGKRRPLFAEAPLTAAFALAVCVVLGTGSAWAQTRYLDDGALQNSRGGWDLPLQGSCPADVNQQTRPECVALRLDLVQASCVAPNYSWTTSGVCNDSLAATQAACEAKPDRLWNAGKAVCAIVMQDDDRNDVVCMLNNGTWSTAGTCTGNWLMPNGAAYDPDILTSAPTSPAGAGDQCLRCHNDVTQYNGPRVRDTEETLFMGHKNMARKVVPGMAWGGPDFSCTGAIGETEDECVHNGGTWDPTIYLSTDTGQVFNWGAGTVTVNGVDRDLLWIFGDWLSALPRAIFKTVASTSKVCSDPRYPSTGTTCVDNGGTLLFNAGVSYSCARCHTTGWTSDAAINTTKEPEKSFPGVTWDRTADAGFGVVNLSGGVSGDANKYASWDAFGITCARCHNAAIDLSIKRCYGIASSAACTLGTWDSRNSQCFSTQASCTTMGGTSWDLPYGAPLGMSSHHNDLTLPDVGSSGTGGYCSDPRFTAQTQCDNSAAAWLTACSIAGVCSNPAFTTSGTCVLGGGTWTKYNSSGACATAGGTWQVPTTACSVAGVCNDPAMTTQAACTGTVSGGSLDGLVRQWRAATDIIRCEDVGGHWTGSKTNRGQIITSLCMNCHRQETAGVPFDSGTDPAGLIKAGPVHGTVDFNLHFHGNQFLNSPHAKFTSTFSDIPTGKFNFAMTGAYKSFFMIDAEAANTGNGCTGCHEVHTSTVAGEHPFREECTACHTKNLGLVMHPTGPGTPLEEMDTEPFETCVACHMPGGQHLFRINVNPSYSAIPMPGAMSATVNANTSPDGNYSNAVWVDIDSACGQCHGGGTAQAKTTGSISANSDILTVASATGLTVGQKIRITGAGSLYYDDMGSGYNADFDSFIKAVAGTTITLAGKATKTVTNAAVAQNAIKNSAGYISKVRLAELAAGMHNDKPNVTFGHTLGNPNTLTVNVDASATLCSGSAANCDAYEWVWGDGTPDGSGVTASHTYATAGAKSITLTVEEYGVGGGSKTKTITVYAPNYPPVAAGTDCGSILDANTWLATIVDASTDDVGVNQVTVNWGDGSIISDDRTAPFGPFTHTYLRPGTFTITHKAIDTIGQQNSRTCTVAPAYFAISGTVYQSDGTTVVPTALVTVKKGTTVVRTVYTAANGTFSAGNLKPGTYTLTVTKTGLTFASPAATIMVGPSSSGNVINALAMKIGKAGR